MFQSPPVSAPTEEFSMVVSERSWGLCVVVACVALGTGCGNESDAGSDGPDEGNDEVPYAPYDSPLYAGLDNWLCNPELSSEDSLCAVDLTATVVEASGDTSLEEHVVAEDPSFDCFYVYPTVSADPETFSDLEPNVEERFIVASQAARLSRHCRVFAPSYRQVTIAGLLESTPDDISTAYEDVLDAFREYIANRNEGRGFVLVGHSQGTFHGIRLIREEIETTPYLAERMIAAYLLGGSAAFENGAVEVPRGGNVGGTFATTPLCERADQFGCVVAYVTFLASNPPSEGAVFGGASVPDNVAACVNPSALGGGSAILDSYYPSKIEGLFGTFIGEVSPWADPSSQETIATPFYKMPGFLEAECREEDGYSFLELTPQIDPDDPRADEIKGELEPLIEGWGTHLIDAYVAMGDMLDLMESQAASWAANR